MKQDGWETRTGQEKAYIAEHLVKVFTSNTRAICPKEEKASFNHQK